MKKYTLSEEVAMYEKALGIKKKNKPKVCPLCSLESNVSFERSDDKNENEKINNKKS